MSRFRMPWATSKWDDGITNQQASLCGHFEVVRLLLESGALCERDTFQGERCCLSLLPPPCSIPA